MTRWVARENVPKNLLLILEFLFFAALECSPESTEQIVHNSASAVFLESFADRIEFDRYRSVDETETIDRLIQTQTERATSERVTNR